MQNGTAYVFNVKLERGRRTYVAFREDGTELFRTSSIHDVSVRLVRRKLRWAMGGTFRDLKDGERPADAIKADQWNRAISQDQQTHTSKLLRGAMRLAADLDVDPDTACMALGAMVDQDRAVADQMMKEGRY